MRRGSLDGCLRRGSPGWLSLVLVFAGCTGRNPAFLASATTADGAPSEGGRDEHVGAGTGGTGQPADAASADRSLGLTEAPAMIPDTPIDAAPIDAAPIDAAPVLDAAAETPPEAPTADAPAADAPGPVSACAGTAPAGWACIAPGTFTMGSVPSSEPDRDSDENLHDVTITRPFWMKATEVTRAEWMSYLSTSPSTNDGCGANCPVNQVTWYQAIALANAWSIAASLPPCYERPTGGAYDAAAASRREVPRWPAGLDCRGYRLPTEAEWEYSARAGTRTAFHDGPITQGTDCDPEPALTVAGWYCGNSNDDIHAVGGKKANAWGLHDMHGSVWEWCWDPGTKDTPYPPGAALDPVGDPQATQRRLRGGSFHNHPAHCRSANRDALPADSTYGDTGLRLARTALP